VRLALPEDVTSALGLMEIDRRTVRLADGSLRELAVAGGLTIEILDRELECDALVLPAGAHRRNLKHQRRPPISDFGFWLRFRCAPVLT
jgi:hypothetical protein